MMNVELMLLALGIAIIRPLFAFAMMSLAGPWQVPWPIQIAVAVVLGLLVMPHIEVATFTSNPIRVLPMLGGEALIGMAIGFSLQLAIAAARIAGELVSTTIGLGFAQILDPEHGHTVPTVAQFMGLLAVAVFMAMDGHVMMIRILADSYTTLPPGGGGLSQQALWAMLQHGDAMFAAGFMMALPVVAATLVVQIAMAVAARMAPALNLLAVGMPATLVGGILMLTLTVPVISDGARSTLSGSFRIAAGVVSDGGSRRDIPMLAQLQLPADVPKIAGPEPETLSAPASAFQQQPFAAPSARALFEAAHTIVRDLPPSRFAPRVEADLELASGSLKIEGLTPVPELATASIDNDSVASLAATADGGAPSPDGGATPSSGAVPAGGAPSSASPAGPAAASYGPAP